MLGKDFSAYLQQRRQALGKSQSDFARALHYSVQAVAKYEKGQSEMNVASLVAAARFLEVDVDSFCAGKAEKSNTLADEHDFDGTLFAANLATLRANAGLTPEDVAKKIGISSRSVINYEKGRFYPSLSVFLAFAECYSVKPSAFFFAPITPTAIPKTPAKRARIHFLPLWIAIASLAVVGTGVGIPLYLNKKNAASTSSFTSEPNSTTTSSAASSQASSALSSSSSSTASSSAPSSTSSSTSSSASNSSWSESVSFPYSTSGKTVTATIEHDSTGFVGASIHAAHFFEDGIEVTDQNYFLRASFKLSDGSSYVQYGNDLYLDYRAIEGQAQLSVTQYVRDLSVTDSFLFRSITVATLTPIDIKALSISDYANECAVAQTQIDFYKAENATWKNNIATAETAEAAVKKEGTDAGYLTAEDKLNVKKSDTNAMAWLSRYVKASSDSLYANEIENDKGIKQARAEAFYSYCYSNS